jgi:hypothetical protein
MKQNILRQGNKINSLLGFLIISIIPMLFAVALVNAETITYNYYETGELKNAVYSNGATAQYTYDLSGNRLIKGISAGAPGISSSPTSVDFGQVVTGTTSAFRTVTITNNGTVALDIESVDITGTNAADFTKQTDTCSSQTIAAEGTCVIGLVFTSQEPLATKTADLQIASNASGAPLLAVNLSGTSYANNSAFLTITRTGTGSGTVTVDSGTLTWNGLTGTAIYTPGTDVSITAAAVSDSRFIAWAGDCLGNSSPCAVTMDANKSVTATFNRLTDFSGTPLTGSLPLTVRFTDLSIKGSLHDLSKIVRLRLTTPLGTSSIVSDCKIFKSVFMFAHILNINTDLS